mgnify:CR=1 FL=1|tara:strand:+ start:6384 stop:7268 length:885 start_codon:yes stop_codon:yes gene_type:complete
MRHIIASLLFFAGLAAPVQAQASRDVLLNVCNQTGFSVAVAAAYRTSPAPARTLRSWFLVEPGACLNGALNGVVGNDLDLHVMSGSWTWPARSTGSVYCVPAGSSFALARQPECGPGQQARNFVNLPVEATSRRGPGGRNFGQVNWRVRCEDLALEDARLCPGAPQDERGMAGFVRELEACNNTTGPRHGTVGTFGPDGKPVFGGWTEVAAGECAVIYRGFPAGNTVLFGFASPQLSPSEQRYCAPTNTGDPAELLADLGASENACPDDALELVYARPIEFRDVTGRMTTYFAG